MDASDDLDAVTALAIRSAIRLGGDALPSWVAGGKDLEERRIRSEAAERYMVRRCPDGLAAEGDVRLLDHTASKGSAERDIKMFTAGVDWCAQSAPGQPIPPDMEPEAPKKPEEK